MWSWAIRRFWAARNFLLSLGPTTPQSCERPIQTTCRTLLISCASGSCKAWGQIKGRQPTPRGARHDEFHPGGANREALKPIVDQGRFSGHGVMKTGPWMALPCGSQWCALMASAGTEARLDNKSVPRIFSDLTGSSSDTTAAGRFDRKRRPVLRWHPEDRRFQHPGRLGPADVDGPHQS